jgi:hypothetical protein
MKPVNTRPSIGMDRLATRSEIACAVSISCQGIIEGVEFDDPHETHPNFTATACKLSEDMWLALASEMADSISN